MEKLALLQPLYRTSASPVRRKVRPSNPHVIFPTFEDEACWFPIGSSFSTPTEFHGAAFHARFTDAILFIRVQLKLHLFLPTSFYSIHSWNLIYIGKSIPKFIVVWETMIVNIKPLPFSHHIDNWFNYFFLLKTSSTWFSNDLNKIH